MIQKDVRAVEFIKGVGGGGTICLKSRKSFKISQTIDQRLLTGHETGGATET